MKQIKTIKAAVKFLATIYNPLIILSVILCFLVVCFFPVKFIPDYFHFAKIENARSFIWSLISATLGFSGLILTVVLVTYNFYLRSTRRNTFEFIMENPFLKIIFSIFSANILVNLLGFALAAGNNKVAILYFLVSITFLYILSLFPLAILSLKYSTSMARIEKLLKKISGADMDFLWRPSNSDDDIQFNRVEQNPIIILKDIGVNAIKDGDWVLPQNILNALSRMVVDVVKDPSKDTLHKTAFCFLFVCKHFKRAALKNGDSILVSCLFGHAVSLYGLIANKQLLHFRHLDLDEYFKELCFNIIQAKDFSDVRDTMMKDIEWILEKSLSKIKYTDEQLPTMHYRTHQRLNNIEVGEYHMTDIRQYWHYLTHTQIEIFTDVIRFAIKHRDERVYEHFHWKAQSFIASIAKLENLTPFQRQQYFDDVFYRLTDLSFFAIEHEVYDYVEVISDVDVVTWIEKGEKRYYENAIFYYSRLLKKLNAVNKLNITLLDAFFMIGRRTSHKDINVQQRIEVLDLIFDIGINLFETRPEGPKAKYYIQQQLSWLQAIIEKEEELLELKNKYSERIKEITKDYSYENFPDW